MPNNKQNLATFAGGCFWCMVAPFAELPGVSRVISGYTGGETENPTYAEVCTGQTGHYEAVQITFDPELTSYEKLLSLFWHQIDPTDDSGQFYDRGPSYRTAIFYHDEEQREQAESSKKQLAEHSKFDRPIVTAILPARTFYPAEEQHQEYHKKHPVQYGLYRRDSGRDEFIDRYWGPICKS